MPRKREQKHEELSFEEALESLNDIVSDMEEGELPLEEALAAFEKGIGLTKACQKKLTDAEQKVSILMQENGEETLQPFEDDDSA